VRMITSSFLRYTLFGLCVLAWALPVFATKNCVNGQLLYNTKAVDGLTCSNSLCHGPDPTTNVNGILRAANDPTIIFAAINGGNEEMEIFQGKFTASDLDDLATWLAFAPNCPSGGAAVSVLPTSYVFLAQDIGTTSAPTTITVSNAGTLPATGVNISSNNAAEFPASSTCAATLSVGASCTISVTFKPSGTGNRSATLRVDSSAGTSTVALSGVAKAPAGNNMLDVIEYYYREFDSYFVTALADEIVKLDNGTFTGWARTGYQFKVHALGTPGSLTVCRFFSVAFGLKSAHFYTPVPEECARVKTNPDWIFEGEVFAIPGARPDGTCGVGTAPIYRLYNNGEGGAPNHRYTTVGTVRDNMVAAGWVIEGNGPGFAFMCAPQ
jgi:hypothetical protein